MTKKTAEGARNTDETAGDLRYIAETLTRLAAALRGTAERMERGLPPDHSINVRHGVGARKAITNTLTPYVQDAARKATQAGAPQ